MSLTFGKKKVKGGGGCISGFRSSVQKSRVFLCHGAESSFLNMPVIGVAFGGLRPHSLVFIHPFPSHSRT